jgi:predicted amidohydrolase
LGNSDASRALTALLAQMPPRVGDVRASADVVADVLHGNAADLAVFPELFLGGYSLEDTPANAITPDSSEIETIRRAAAATSTAVVVGFIEKTEHGLANSAACIDKDGALRGVYRKMQLFGRERDVFESGNSLLVAQLAGRQVGVQICFDTEFPEVARALARAGAEMLVTISANMSPYYADHELATRARALDNRIPHVYANLVGGVRGVAFVGGSRAISPDGTVLAEANADSEELLAVPIRAVEPIPELNYRELAPTAPPAVTKPRVAQPLA